MKGCFSILTVLAVTVLVNAQPPAQQSPVSGADPATTMERKAPLCQSNEAHMMMEKRGCMMGKEKGETEGRFSQGCCVPNARFPMNRNHRGMPCFKAMKAVAAMVFLCTMICLLLHILLTILVFNDMRNRKDIQGLWLVIVLIGGLFATIAYMLYRMGNTGLVQKS
jgi:hypothetical protein